MKMKNNIVSDILKYLEKFNAKPINIEQMGFVSSQFFVERLVYNVNYDILNLKDEMKNIHLSIKINKLFVSNFTNMSCTTRIFSIEVC